jgi:hypothetical protein
LQIHALSDAALLDIWERCDHLHPLDQALALLETACPDISRQALAELSIGRRDSLLLRLREATLGPSLAGHGHCPACTQEVEFQIGIGDLCALQPHQSPTSHWTLSITPGRLQGRLPNSLDLAAVAGCDDPGVARRTLALRCLQSTQPADQPLDPDDLSEESMSALGAHIADADPLADIQLHFRCPACDHQWEQTLDITIFFWREISERARRLLRQIHLLAWAYGWREKEILALPPRRRKYYLDMVSQWTS